VDFALLPPEINSGRMYSGPGAGPMLAAAASWDALAAELQTVGMVYESVISELSTGWSGPSAAAMVAAAAPYAKWMHATSAQAEQTANQARTAATAYETAFAMTVPPPVVAANRAQLMTLVATNFLGQNTPAIAATEAHYAQMWAQDAAAMYNYAGTAAAASQLTPFTQPPHTTNPAGSANQAGAVGQAAATAAGSHTNTLASAITQALHGLTSPAAAAPAPNTLALLNPLALAASATPAALHLSLAGTELGADFIGSFGIDVLGTFLIDALGAIEFEEALLPFMAASSVTPVSAGLGQAASIGALSVPPAWTVAAQSVVHQVGLPLPAAGAATAPALAASETAIPIAGMAGAGLAGRATAAVGRGGGGRAGTTTRQRPTPQQQPKPPEQQDQPPETVYGLITGLDIELRELAELRAASVLTDEEYAEEKRRLLGR
jgi:PPE-repeat protein